MSKTILQTIQEENYDKFVQGILDKRYLVKDKALLKEIWGGHTDPIPESKWSDIAHRVARKVANGDKKKYKIYFDLINEKKFIPNSPTLFGAGVPGISLSACYVIRVQDSIEGWGKAFSDAMKIQVCGGGIGFDLSEIRPKGSSAGRRAKAAGPVAFMRAWNAITQEFRQSVRNGATLCQLHCSHDDIEEFITCKDKDGDLSYMNISVAVTNKFMEEKNDPKVMRLQRLIVEMAHKTGDPGLIFIDRVEADNKHPELGKLMQNPCLSGNTKFNAGYFDDGIDMQWGIFTIEELKQFIDKGFGDYYLLDYFGKQVKLKKVWSNGIKPVIKLILSNGDEITCTRDHEICTVSHDEKHMIPVFAPAIFTEGERLFDTDLRVVKIIDKKEEIEVFDFEVDSPTHCAQLHNGVVVSNCSEATLHDYSACNLGSINLTKMCKNGDFDFSLFEKTICDAYEMLDSVIDINPFPLPEIDKRVKELRPIGLGVMGLADVIAMMGYKYGSPRSKELTDEIFKTLKTASELMNTSLGDEKGNYPLYKGRGFRRNVTMNTVPPTGTTSIFAGCSAGIEPVFSYQYERRITNSDGTYEDVQISHPHQPPEHLMVTANDLSIEGHIDMVAIAQKHIDMAISKTINLPEWASVEDVRKAFQLSWEKGLKGITVYRDKCKEGQVLKSTKNEELIEKKDKIVEGIDKVIKEVPNITREDLDRISEMGKDNRINIAIDPIKMDKLTETMKNLPTLSDETIAKAFIIPQIYPIKPIQRPAVLHGFTHKEKIGCGNLYVTVNKDESGKVLEVLVEPGKNGGCDSNSEAIARLISLCLRCNVDVKEIIDQLRGVRCISCVRREGVQALSCPDAVSKILEKHYQSSRTKIKETCGRQCIQCGQETMHMGDICYSCNQRRNNITEKVYGTMIRTPDVTVNPPYLSCKSCGKTLKLSEAFRISMEKEEFYCQPCHTRIIEGYKIEMENIKRIPSVITKIHCPDPITFSCKSCGKTLKPSEAYQLPTDTLDFHCKECHRGIMEKNYRDAENKRKSEEIIKRCPPANKCPDCGLFMGKTGDGCWQCKCGYSKCG